MHSNMFQPRFFSNPLQNAHHIPSSFYSPSDEIISSSKTLMSVRLIEIENQILQMFQKYPPHQKNLLKQMFYQNIDSLPTLQAKISYLLMLVESKDISRLNQYMASVEKGAYDASLCIDSSVPLQSFCNHQLSNLHPCCLHQHKNMNLHLDGPQTNSFQANQCLQNNKQNAMYGRDAKSPSYSQSPTLHKYNSEASLYTALPDESLHSCLANSEQSDSYREFKDIERKRKLEAKQNRISNLIESGKISSQLKLLKMAKKLSKYQNQNSNFVQSAPSIKRHYSTTKQDGPNKNYVQTPNYRPDLPLNRSLRQNTVDKPYDLHGNDHKDNYQLKDQFSFRQGRGQDSRYSEDVKNLERTKSQKDFGISHNEYGNDFEKHSETKRRLTEKSLKNNYFQEDQKQRGNRESAKYNLQDNKNQRGNRESGKYSLQDNKRHRGNPGSGKNDESYESHLSKLTRLKEKKKQRQINGQVSTKTLDQRIESLFNISDSQRNSKKSIQFRKQISQNSINHNEEQSQRQKTDHNICYSSSDNISFNSDEESDEQNDESHESRQAREFSKTPGGQKQRIDKNDFFKKKTDQIPSFSTIISKPNMKKSSTKLISNKASKVFSKSSQSPLKFKQSNHSRTQANFNPIFQSTTNQMAGHPNCTNRQAQQRHRDLKKHKIPFEKKFTWTKKNGELGDFDLDPSQFSPEVKRYFSKRRKVIPIIIPGIPYQKSESNQGQLVSRKKLQKSRQRQVQQKMNRSETLKHLRNMVDKLDV